MYISWKTGEKSRMVFSYPLLVFPELEWMQLSGAGMAAIFVAKSSSLLVYASYLEAADDIRRGSKQEWTSLNVL